MLRKREQQLLFQRWGIGVGRDHGLGMRLKSGAGVGMRRKRKGGGAEDRVVDGDRHRDELGDRNGVENGIQDGDGGSVGKGFELRDGTVLEMVLAMGLELGLRRQKERVWGQIMEDGVGEGEGLKLETEIEVGCGLRWRWRK